jgi:hypothetical protein
MMDLIGLIVIEVSLTCQQLERLWLNYCRPIPRHAADWAIAFESTGTQIDVRFITDRATMTISGVFLFHQISLIQRASNRWQDTVTPFF